MNASGFSKNLTEDIFKLGAKEIEGEHVEDQMHVVAVNKPRGNYPIVLAGIDNPVRIHHKAIEQPRFLHSV